MQGWPQCPIRCTYRSAWRGILYSCAAVPLLWDLCVLEQKRITRPSELWQGWQEGLVGCVVMWWYRPAFGRLKIDDSLNSRSFRNYLLYFAGFGG